MEKLIIGCFVGFLICCFLKKKDLANLFIFGFILSLIAFALFTTPYGGMVGLVFAAMIFGYQVNKK